MTTPARDDQRPGGFAEEPLALRLKGGQTLAAALVDLRHPLRTDCGGAGKCGQCRVRLGPGENLPAPTTAEKAQLALSELAAGYRLACQVRPERPLTVTVFPPHDGAGFVRCAVAEAACRRRPGAVGVAIDLGTSRVDVALYGLGDGRPLVSVSGDNAQRAHGDDVVSRIAAAGDPAVGPERMQGLAVETIDRLIRTGLAAGGMASGAIQRVAICGNTAMTLILAGLDVRSLGVYPYRPPVAAPPSSTAGALGLAMAPDVPVYLFPAVSGFIGGDTVSALLADGADRARETVLLVDIGTNGELVLCRAGRILAASCATGPAFEGARLSCGMPAVDGAIDRLSIDPRSRRLDWHVIGAEKGVLPAGLCGSGVVDALAGLVAAGVIAPDGLLDRQSPLVSMGEEGPAIELVAAGKTRHGRPLILSQKDIGEVQLAKAALCAGIQLLLYRSGGGSIARTVLTGAFGAGFDWRKAAAIGMLPPAVAAGTVTAAAGLAGQGAALALRDKDLPARALALSRRIAVLELGGDPQFRERFLAALAFPAPAVTERGKGPS